ncbi:hypothetical protein K9909_003145 [Salmonella enterica subsp. enterica serovar Newport]|nr:hypothetical protein [Salmonella enterica subsp. enterica serovar Newport]EHS5152855.1 hypothetical protein [Salmonella enterica subsp. enterica serovar Newport]EHV5816225.1 hypothetical protein [Salmonella enterica subsp. enterica serovar Newport]EIC3608398.1 hypothetical protein [Salmonella enterica subsp. enterica serovar Newport]EJB3597461.1 hypothetical protein [Salmonella enterica subsp. enterica serovar Newport]
MWLNHSGCNSVFSVSDGRRAFSADVMALPAPELMGRFITGLKDTPAVVVTLWCADVKNGQTQRCGRPVNGRGSQTAAGFCGVLVIYAII